MRCVQMSQLLQNALYGTTMILVVAVLRRVLKERLVPEARLALWAVCLFRLLTPAAPESVLSLWGLSRLLAPEKQAAPMPTGPVYVPGLNTAAPAPQPNPGISWETVLLALWLAVGAVLAARYVVSWRRTRRAVSCAIPLNRDDPRYTSLPKCARLREGPMEGAPLTFGAVRPTVVLSPGLDGEALDCVLAHEGVHAQRRDNLWHYATALALVVHWWNPAVWLMSRLLRRDIELSCDRAALKKLGEERRVDYAQALVSLATQDSGPAFCQTFGRKAAEERILSIMKFKKISVIGVVFTLALVLAVTAAFASEPKEPQNDAVAFHGQTFSRSGLSQETLDWLDWYLALSEEEQLAISYIPVELRNNQSPEVYDAYGSEKVNSQIVSVPDVDATKGIQSDLPEVAPDDVDLNAMKERLSQQVAGGELTQEEADTILTGVEGMLELARQGELKLVMDSTGNIYGLGISTMYYEDENGDLHPADSYDYIVEPANSTNEHTLLGYSQYISIDGYTEADLNGEVVPGEDLSRISDYKVRLPDFDEDGNPVADGIVGTHYSTYYPLCTDENCEITETHVHASGKVIYVDYQNPYVDYQDLPEDPVPVPSMSPEPTIAQPLTATAPSTSCGVEGCTETRYHVHNSGYTLLLSDPCPVEGCTITGSHIHGDTCYSCNGAGHDGGVCDGTCYTRGQPSQTAGATSSSTHHSDTHHNSGHHH